MPISTIWNRSCPAGSASTSCKSSGGFARNMKSGSPPCCGRERRDSDFKRVADHAKDLNHDHAFDRNTERLARSADRASQGGEGADASQRRGGTATAGAAVGQGGEGLLLRDRRRQRCAQGPVQRPLAAA